jgi:predicted component of type VI protein secretion system
MRVAVDALLRMFSPAQLQAKFKNSAKVGRLLSLNKSNANWELYLKWYASLSTDGDDDFQQMFATEFGRAYEAQIARLLEARAKGEP